MCPHLHYNAGKHSLFFWIKDCMVGEFCGGGMIAENNPLSFAIFLRGTFSKIFGGDRRAIDKREAWSLMGRQRHLLPFTPLVGVRDAWESQFARGGGSETIQPFLPVLHFAGGTIQLFLLLSHLLFLLVQLFTCPICPFAFTYSCFFVILSVLLLMHKVYRKVGCSFSQKYGYIALVHINHICFFATAEDVILRSAKHCIFTELSLCSVH